MNLQEAIAFMKQTGSMKRFKSFSNYISPSHYLRPHGIHGMNHARRVLSFAELLAALEDLPETERDILATAAVYHDIGRTNDGKDSCRCYEVSGRKKAPSSQPGAPKPLKIVGSFRHARD